MEVLVLCSGLLVVYLAVRLAIVKNQRNNVEAECVRQRDYAASLSDSLDLRDKDVRRLSNSNAFFRERLDNALALLNEKDAE